MVLLGWFFPDLRRIDKGYGDNVMVTAA
jgi:hypothetical protein